MRIYTIIIFAIVANLVAFSYALNHSKITLQEYSGKWFVISRISPHARDPVSKCDWFSILPIGEDSFNEVYNFNSNGSSYSLGATGTIQDGVIHDNFAVYGKESTLDVQCFGNCQVLLYKVMNEEKTYGLVARNWIVAAEMIDGFNLLGNASDILPEYIEHGFDCVYN